MYNNTILFTTYTIFPLKTAEYLTECNKLHNHMQIYAIALCCTKRLFIVNQQQKKGNIRIHWSSLRRLDCPHTDSIYCAGNAIMISVSQNYWSCGLNKREYNSIHVSRCGT